MTGNRFTGIKKLCFLRISTVTAVTEALDVSLLSKHKVVQIYKRQKVQTVLLLSMLELAPVLQTVYECV